MITATAVETAGMSIEGITVDESDGMPHLEIPKGIPVIFSQKHVEMKICQNLKNWRDLDWLVESCERQLRPYGTLERICQWQLEIIRLESLWDMEPSEK